MCIQPNPRRAPPSSASRWHVSAARANPFAIQMASRQSRPKHQPPPPPPAWRGLARHSPKRFLFKNKQTHCRRDAAAAAADQQGHGPAMGPAMDPAPGPSDRHVHRMPLCRGRVPEPPAFLGGGRAEYTYTRVSWGSYGTRGKSGTAVFYTRFDILELMTRQM